MACDFPPQATTCPLRWDKDDRTGKRSGTVSLPGFRSTAGLGNAPKAQSEPQSASF